MEDKEEVKIDSKKDDIVKDEDLPTLDDLLQCFTADGVFEKKHKDLLTGFLTTESNKFLEELLEKH
jgi:hypothetical protein